MQLQLSKQQTVQEHYILSFPCVLKFEEEIWKFEMEEGRQRETVRIRKGRTEMRDALSL